MVQTRSQYRRWREETQRRPARARQSLSAWRKRYRPTDPHKRHRLPDRQPKTKVVRTYVRRT